MLFAPLDGKLPLGPRKRLRQTGFICVGISNLFGK